MNAIFQFENYPEVAQRLKTTFLEPSLKEHDLLRQTEIFFQDYISRNSPGAPIKAPALVAAESCAIWDNADPVYARTVWILDLDPSGSSTVDHSYGLCVLVSLAKQFGLSIDQLLSKEEFLFIILTLYPEPLQRADGVRQLVRPKCDLSSLGSTWPDIFKITRDVARAEQPNVARAIVEARERKSRAILAHTGTDEHWVAKVISEWLR